MDLPTTVNMIYSKQRLVRGIFIALLLNSYREGS